MNVIRSLAAITATVSLSTGFAVAREGTARAVTVERARWAVGVDSRYSSQWMAETRGMAFVQQHNRLAGVRVSDGRVRWASRDAIVGAPVAADGVVFASFGHGTFGAFDPNSGTPIFRTSPAPASLSFEPSLVASRNFVVTMTSFGSGVRRLIAYSAHGVVVWQRDLPDIGEAHVRLLTGADVIAITTPTGITFVRGDTGAVVRTMQGASEIIGEEGRHVFVRIGEAATFGRLDLFTGIVPALTILRDVPVASHISVGGGYIVAQVAATAYRLWRLNGDFSASELPTSAYPRGSVVAGPVRDRMFIDGADGLWEAQLATGSLPMHPARRLIAYATNTGLTVDLDRDALYAGLDDGRLVTIDLERDRVAATTATGCNFFEGITASGMTTLVHCDPKQRLGREPSLVLALPRYALRHIGYESKGWSVRG